jgi:glutamate dehydrogenase
VNIKILMDVLLRKGAVKGREERNRILAEMTEEVAELVLADNENQALALTLDGMRCAGRYEDFVSLVDDMVAAGVLNRQDDGIPTRDELLASAQRDRGLPRPLLAVLLGHSKMYAFDMVLESDFPDSAAARPLLEGYFPKRMHEQYGQYLGEHRLRREIVGTVAVNHVINRAGITFLPRMMASTKAGIGEIISAYLSVDRESGAPAVRDQVLASGRSAEEQHQTLLRIEEILETASREWLSGGKVDVRSAVESARGSLGA